MTVGVCILLAIACALLGRLVRSRPQLVIHVPYRIDTNEADVFGSYRPEGADYRVIFYVFPEDDTNTYYRICFPAERMSAGGFQGRVRFGNEIVRDNDRLPAHFAVFGALVAAGQEGKLPATCNRPAVVFDDVPAFNAALRAAGALAISPPARTVRVVGPPPSTVELLSPTSGALVFSPVLCAWKPNRVLSREIWTHCMLVESVSGDDKSSGETLRLEPGRYEIKLRENRTSRVVAQAFFDVLPPNR